MLLSASRKGTVLATFSWRSHVMPLHALVFLLLVRMVEPAFITSHSVEREIITFSCMSLKQL
jgi:hypothetical protein